MSDYPRRPFTCTRARLHARLAELLNDGTGRIRPELQPLVDSLLAMPKPDRALNSLRNNPRLAGYLRALARDEVPLTHDGLHRLDSRRTAAHLRDLLMTCGALPPSRSCCSRAGPDSAWPPATTRTRVCCASSPPGISSPSCTPPRAGHR